MTINSTRGDFAQEIVNPMISDWLKMSVPVGSLSDFSVSLIGVRGDSYTGDIAIDDTKFVDCAPTCRFFCSIFVTFLSIFHSLRFIN